MDSWQKREASIFKRQGRGETTSTSPNGYWFWRPPFHVNLFKKKKKSFCIFVYAIMLPSSFLICHLYPSKSDISIILIVANIASCIYYVGLPWDLSSDMLHTLIIVLIVSFFKKKKKLTSTSRFWMVYCGGK